MYSLSAASMISSWKRVSWVMIAAVSALDVGLGGGLQLLLQLLEHGVGQILAGELRGQRVDLRQRPVAFFRVLHIEIRDHGRAARDHADQLLVLQQLERLPHGRAG